ncbi:MAG: efflux RND transporter permease subunit [Acidobacteria bacterium]|nr:efflux RND transporter permease subunit [Acidobacteriota bacterium]
MWLINTALRRPITIVVAVLGIALMSWLALTRMAVDTFPNLNLPVIYVAQPYGGMDPAQMEGFLVNYYEYHFLYISGVEHVESKSIQGAGLVKIFFHPGTDMSQALAQVVSYVERSRAFMPPGTVAPFVVRYDAGSVPVGYLTFTSETRDLGEISDLALFRVRPVFSTLPGVSAPPPFGGNQRTVIIRADPDKLRQYQMSPEEVVKAVASGNTILPAGNVRIGDLQRLAPINSIVSNPSELSALPIRTGNGPTVFVRDIGRVELGSDILTGYGLINERRTVYIPVTKRAEASTLDVVNRVKSEVPNFQKLIPEDIKVGFEFDQSVYVKNSVRGLALEGALGAILTGLMVLLFLRDVRSALIVIITIPVALLAALVGLWLAGQTVNIMTLGGLALAIGILVDESTVAIENIHTHLMRGETKAQAVLAATRETITPRLLAMLAILAVFVPSFLMVGVSRALFVPLSLAVGFAMLASYFLSNTLVPVLSIWWLKEHRSDQHEAEPLEKVQQRFGRGFAGLMKLRWLVLACYILLAVIGLVFIGRNLGTDIFPNVDTGAFSLRLRAPTGTRVERTEVIALNVLKTIREEAKNQVEITIGYVGTQPPSYPVNTIHQWTSGPHEAILLVKLNSGSGIKLTEFKERLRTKLQTVAPGTSFSFEAGDIVTQVMNFGAPTPIEVALNGPNLATNRAFAEKVLTEMKKIPSLRDLQFAQPLDYPTVDIKIDRERAGQLGLTVDQVGRSLVAATSSSRFTQPNYWRDPASGVAYQVQVEIPQARIASIEDIQTLPASSSTSGKGSTPLIGDVASLSYGTSPGEYDRYNQARMLTITGNIAGADLGSVATAVNEAIKRAGEVPRGVSVNVRGQVPAMQNTLTGLGTGLLLAIVAIFLLLAGYFQSVRVALIALSSIPAVLAGVAIALWITGTTLNVQSFMGGIMAIGVSSANAILLVTFAEQYRKQNQDAVAAALESARTRLRPILMTSLAMIAGMIPMALALGEGGEQTAPLGRAVIGGLVASTFAVLVVVPLIFAMSQRKAKVAAVSLHPDDVPVMP